MRNEENTYVPWKRYTLAIAEAVFIFTTASFLLGLYIMHRGSITTTVLLSVLYALIVIASIIRMVRKFSVAALMLMVPIAPLIILMIVVSLIHFMQYFR